MTTESAIINITISRQTAVTPQESFGIMAVAAQFTTFTDRIRYYESTAAMISDGFLNTDPAYLSVQAAFSQTPRPVELAVIRKDPTDANWGAALTAVVAVDNTWYGLVACDNAAASIEGIAAWAEAATPQKLFVGLTGDAGVINPASTSDVAYTLMQSAYTHTALMYHPTPATDPADAAWMAQMFCYAAGSATWMFKTLTGITTYVLSDTAAGAVVAKNCNLYQTIGGQDMTREGVVAVGEYIDVIYGIDAFQSDMQTAIFGPLKTSPKVSLTDPGITIIHQAMAGSIGRYTETDTNPNLLSKNPPAVITTPTRASLSQTQISQRQLTGCTFSAQLAEAIHYVGVAGTVTL